MSETEEMTGNCIEFSMNLLIAANKNMRSDDYRNIYGAVRFVDLAVISDNNDIFDMYQGSTKEERVKLIAYIIEHVEEWDEFNEIYGVELKSFELEQKVNNNTERLNHLEDKLAEVETSDLQKSNEKKVK